MLVQDLYFGTIKLVPPERVFARACVQLGFVYRASLEKNKPKKSDIIKLRKWLDVVAPKEPSAIELKILLAAPGTLSKQDYLDCGWATESLGVFAWCLGLHEIPPPDHQFAVTDDILNSLGFLEQRVKQFTSLSKTAEEVRQAASLARLILWRMRDFDCGGANVDLTALGAVTNTPIPPEILSDRHDLAFKGRPLAECESSEISIFKSITIERYRAAAWLVGVHDTFAEVPLDT